MATDHWLTYRGAPTALLVDGESLLLTTEHSEAYATALYRIDLNVGSIKAADLPGGARTAIQTDAGVFIAGTDGSIYRAKSDGSAPKAFASLDALFLGTAGKNIAVVTTDALHILDAKGKTTQTLDLDITPTAFATDPSGQWLVIGTQKGALIVFSNEETKAYVETTRGPVHTGSVEVALFEPDDLKVRTFGGDKQIRLTHVRGSLDIEDRSSSNGHSGPVRALTSLGDRLYTVGDDKALKIWTRGKKRPSSYKDPVGRAVALATLTLKGKPHLVIAAQDGTIRLFLLDADGNVALRKMTLHGAIDTAKHQLKDRSPVARRKVVNTLAGYTDSAALRLLGQVADGDQDHAMRVHATTLIGTLSHAGAAEVLKALLKAKASDVRLAAFEGLRTQLGTKELEPMIAALKVGLDDIGIAAISALAALKDTDADVEIIKALDNRNRAVRFAALQALEGRTQGAQASLIALKINKSDIRWQAVLRLYQRKLLDSADAQGAVRRALADSADDVRQIAFQVLVLNQPSLAAALRHLDKTLHRQLHDLETYDTAKAKKPPRTKAVKPETLDGNARRPLLESMASRALDSSVRGASGLALLGDRRALGALLQLSRADDTAARVDVCRALGHLKDPQATARLRTMVMDEAQTVRDAAYTALSDVLGKKPLELVEAGMISPHVDVRRRALQTLVRALKKSATKAGKALLARALNDASDQVQNDALKATLRLDIEGDPQKNLEFLLASRFPAVRREAVTEIMAQIKAPWAWELLLTLFDDPDRGIRIEALTFARKKSRGREWAPLERALKSPHSDIREAALDALTEKAKKAASHALLLAATDDKNPALRLKALSALVKVDADAAVTQAMESTHPNVRIAAAAARAQTGDPAASGPLLAQIQSELPTLTEEKTRWTKITQQALRGLQQLGDPNSAEAIEAHLASDDASTRALAAEALAWTTADTAPLERALRHTDSVVQQWSAQGLAWLGDRQGLSTLSPQQLSGRKKARKRGRQQDPHAFQRLIAALTLGIDDLLFAALGSNDSNTQRTALRVLMLLVWQQPERAVDRLVSALTAGTPRVRLQAAHALRTLDDRDALRAQVTMTLTAQPQDRRRTLDDAVIDQIAAGVTHTDGRMIARILPILPHLDATEPARFDTAWGQLTARFADMLGATPEGTPAGTHEEHRELAVGAYIGLSRHGNSSYAPVRIAAIKALALLVSAKEIALIDLVPVCLQAFDDSHGQVRKTAFKVLADSDYPRAQLGAEALASAHSDIGVAGLELLGTDAKGTAALTLVMQTRTDQLAAEAARLLAERGEPAKIYAAALTAAYPRLRSSAVEQLATLYEIPAAQTALHKALNNADRSIRASVALRIAKRKDVAALPVLRELLWDREERTRRRAATALLSIGDPAGLDHLLDRLEDRTPGLPVDADLLEQVGQFRLTSAADRLLALFNSTKSLRSPIFGAMTTICGYDNRYSRKLIGHPPEVDAEAIAKQPPRHPDVFARAFDAAANLPKPSWTRRTLEDARWSPQSTPLDAAYATFSSHPNEALRHLALESLSFRARRRGASTAPLSAALKHRDPTTQFLAAEGLALAGINDGASILLSTIELSESHRHRVRAIQALGVLGEPRALDVMLRLVNEDGHALQESAAAAIGRFADSSQHDAIFQVLKRLAAGDAQGVAQEALVGLRWFNTADAWAIVRNALTHPRWSVREKIAQMLVHNDDSQTHTALLKQLRKDDDWDVVQACLKSLRTLLDEDSLEPDYAFIHSDMFDGDTDFEAAVLKRLTERGDSTRLFDALRTGLSDEVQVMISDALQQRDPAPIKAALVALSDPNHLIGATAAAIIGQTGDAPAKTVNVALKAQIDDLPAAITKAEAGWDGTQSLQKLGIRLERLVWASGRVGGDATLLASLLSYQRPELFDAQRAGITALAQMGGETPGVLAKIKKLVTKASAKKAVDLLAELTNHPNATLRTMAASALTAMDPKRARSLVGDSLDDGARLARLPVEDTKPLHSAALDPNRQGVVIPILAARGDLKALLVALAADEESVQQGAIDGLSRIASDDAVDALRTFAADDKNDEPLRQSAWRAVRRALRRRARAEESAR